MLYAMNSPYGKGQEQMTQAIGTYGKRQREKPKPPEDKMAPVKNAVSMGTSAYKLKDLYDKWSTEGADGVENSWSRDNIANLPEAAETQTPLESMQPSEAVGGDGPGSVDIYTNREPITAMSGDPAMANVPSHAPGGAQPMPGMTSTPSTAPFKMSDVPMSELRGEAWQMAEGGATADLGAPATSMPGPATVSSSTGGMAPSTTPGVSGVAPSVPGLPSAPTAMAGVSGAETATGATGVDAVGAMGGEAAGAAGVDAAATGGISAATTAAGTEVAGATVATMGGEAASLAAAEAAAATAAAQAAATTAAGGAATGAASGAAAGSVVPGIGTLIGAVVGGIGSFLMA